MTRRLFEIQAARSRIGALANGAIYVIYSDAAGTVPADIAASVDGTAISGSVVTTSDIAGLGPGSVRFYGPPSGTDTLYIRSSSDATLGIQKIRSDADERLDALEVTAGGALAVSVLDAKGDLLAASAADTPARLAVGSAGAQLVPDASAATGLKWQSPVAVNVMAPPINADNTGTADCLAAFTAAKTAAGVNGEVIVPNGTYLVSAQFILDVVGQRWTLAPQATVKLMDGANNPLLVLHAVGVVVDGGIWDGNKDNQTAAWNLVHLNRDDCKFQNATVQNVKGKGLHIYNADRLKVRRVRVIDTTDTGIFGQVESTQTVDRYDWDISECEVDRTAIGSVIDGGGIRIQGTTTRKIRNLKIRGNTARLPRDPGAGSGRIPIEVAGGGPYALVANNYTYGGGWGISVDSSEHVAVIGNICVAGQTYGIEMAGVDYGLVVGNTIDGDDLTVNGIALIGSALATDYLTIAGNTIRNLKSGASSFAIVANSVAHATNITITGNTILNSAVGSGVWLVDSEDFVVTGNLIVGGINGVLLNRTKKGVITGNHLADITVRAITLTSSSAYTFTDITISGNTFVGNAINIAATLSGGAALGARIRVTGNAGEHKDYWDYANNVYDGQGAGTPEGVETAGIGSTWRRGDGGAGTSFYVKESGTGSAGWVGK